MMKRIIPYVLVLLWCNYPCRASLSTADEAADGYLTAGEYDASGPSLENHELLIVNGGGADLIDAWDNSRIEVYSTSLPLSLYDSGVYDIHLSDNSTLLFSGGATESLVLYKNSSALLTGGTINYITIYHRPVDSCSVTIDCQDGWQWLYTSGTITGIKGLWQNGSPFQITLSNVGSPWPLTAQYVNVVPEPTTMLLLGLGGMLIRKKK